MRTVLLVPAAAAARSTRSANDANGLATVFVYDTQAGTTTLVSVKRSGAQVDDDTVGWDMSKRRPVRGVQLAQPVHGRRPEPRHRRVRRRFVAFNGAKANELPQIYVRDRLKKTTTLVSVNVKGRPGNRSSFDASISPNGRFVAFTATADDMASPGPQDFAQVYVRDLQAKTTVLASVTSTGVPIPQSSGETFMCDAGVGFNSFNPNVVPDGNDKEQVYFRST